MNSQGGLPRVKQSNNCRPDKSGYFGDKHQQNQIERCIAFAKSKTDLWKWMKEKQKKVKTCQNTDR